MHFNSGPHKVQKVIPFVRIAGASHGITASPSHLIGKVAHVLKWFAEHGGVNSPA